MFALLALTEAKSVSNAVEILLAIHDLPLVSDSYSEEFSHRGRWEEECELLRNIASTGIDQGRKKMLISPKRSM